ncbi:DNA repair protein RecO [Candidatus Terasakiella magnetica]|uniref:DNA repair protein RecO n=1 Tax=Candidatus Terasakiella magnetica TaxID=1867952 RepID=A0A1C3RCV1_9PROT|nr:DNA repair protein RecO [Candidatus Terasakiella magnetica]SCA55100.1 DNA repair protein RecO [Candidatus Terasakiella magnetica]
MIWTDHAIVLSTRKHGESSVIISVLTRKHGRHLGLVRGGASKKLAALLQPGNLLSVEWKGRLEEHLGVFQVEMETAHGAKALSSREKLTNLNTVCAMCEACLAERQEAEGIFGATLILLDMLDETRLWPELYQRWELGLLNELGFGLDLSCCAASRQTGDLIYISPKTGRAVSRNAGEPFKDKLFPLPYYLLVDEVKPTKKDLLSVFIVTAHFIERCVLAPMNKKIPSARTRFIDRLK